MTKRAKSKKKKNVCTVKHRKPMAPIVVPDGAKLCIRAFGPVVIGPNSIRGGGEVEIEFLNELE